MMMNCGCLKFSNSWCVVDNYFVNEKGRNVIGNRIFTPVALRSNVNLVVCYKLQLAAGAEKYIFELFSEGKTAGRVTREKIRPILDGLAYPTLDSSSCLGNSVANKKTP